MKPIKIALIGVNGYSHSVQIHTRIHHKRLFVLHTISYIPEVMKR